MTAWVEVCPVDALVPNRGVAALVGDIDGTPTVASPVYKQRFDLRTGRCVDDESVRVRTWRVRKGGGIVEVRSP